MSVPKRTAPRTSGRVSRFAGKRITKLVSTNPRRKGSLGYKAFAGITNGMTYEQYVAKFDRKHLAYDVRKKHVKLAK